MSEAFNADTAATLASAIISSGRLDINGKDLHVGTVLKAAKAKELVVDEDNSEHFAFVLRLMRRTPRYRENNTIWQFRLQVQAAVTEWREASAS